MFTAQWFSLGGMRCSPLNAALCVTTVQIDIVSVKSTYKFTVARIEDDSISDDSISEGSIGLFIRNISMLTDGYLLFC